MRINSYTTNAEYFAYDDCHKIYLLEDTKDFNEAIVAGFSIYPVNKIVDIFYDSCPLRFISNWQLTKTFVEQGEDIVLYIP